MNRLSQAIASLDAAQLELQAAIRADLPKGVRVAWHRNRYPLFGFVTHYPRLPDDRVVIRNAKTHQSHRVSVRAISLAPL